MKPETKKAIVHELKNLAYEVLGIVGKSMVDASDRHKRLDSK